MVRTRADVVTSRVAGAKAARKNTAGPSNQQVGLNGAEKSNKGGGGNSYFPRETPDWQKPITSFFIRPNESVESTKSDERMDLIRDDSSAGASTSKQDTTE